MAILRTRERWNRPKPPALPGAPRRPSAVLTADEYENIKKALRVLRLRLGSAEAASLALGMGRKAVELALKRRRRPSPVFAILVARHVGVPIEDVLSGAWPKAGSCPMCGRCEG